MQDLDILNNSYLIIGGPNTKKSEVSRYLSKKYNLKLINLDREKHSFFDDFTDYDSSKYYNLLDSSFDKAINYIHKYEMKHLNYVLDNIKDKVVIDFGNTYTLIDDINILNKIKLFNNIILLTTKNINDEFDRKLVNNKINNDIKKVSISVDNKSIESIIKEIENYKNYKDIL